jgi:glycosyltransferase involved in cell wall biosynthesis
VPAVSVVIPTRDRAPQLGEALHTVLRQRDVELEVIVVDDGSRQGSVTAIEQVRDPRVRVLSRSPPTGVSRARNDGVASARARWIAFLDDDDLWAPDKLARQLSALEARGGTFAYTGVVVVDAQRRPTAVSSAPSEAGLRRSLLRTNAVGSPSSVVIDRGTFERAGGFDPSFSALADWDLWLRLATDGVPVACAEVLTAYTEHPGNMVLAEMQAIEAQMARLRTKHAALTAAAGEPLGGLAWARWIAACHRRAGRRRDAASAYWRAGVEHRSPQDLALAPALLLAAAGRLPRRSPRPLPTSFEWLEPDGG